MNDPRRAFLKSLLRSLPLPPPLPPPPPLRNLLSPEPTDALEGSLPDQEASDLNSVHAQQNTAQSARSGSARSGDRLVDAPGLAFYVRILSADDDARVGIDVTVEMMPILLVLLLLLLSILFFVLSSSSSSSSSTPYLLHLSPHPLHYPLIFKLPKLQTHEKDLSFLRAYSAIWNKPDEKSCQLRPRIPKS